MQAQPICTPQGALSFTCYSRKVRSTGQYTCVTDSSKGSEGPNRCLAQDLVPRVNVLDTYSCILHHYSRNIYPH